MEVKAQSLTTKARKMTQFCAKTLEAIQALLDGVDGCNAVSIKRADEHEPVGDVQDCDTGHVEAEWVDQHGPGMAGDDFFGTVTWKLGEHYLIAYYAT